MLFRQFWKATNLARHSAGLTALDLDSALDAHREYLKVNHDDPDAEAWEKRMQDSSVFAGNLRATMDRFSREAGR